MQETTVFPVPGLLKFSSIRGLRLYLKDLMAQYERECDFYGDKVGKVMRILDAKLEGVDLKKLHEIGWKKVGMLMVHDEEPTRGTLELMIEAMEDYKAKATRTREVLTNLDELDNLGIPEGAALLVYLRHGVPLRIVVDSQRSPEIDALLTTRFY